MNSSVKESKDSFPHLFKLTFPYVKRALWSRRPLLIGLLLASIGLGIVPTMKSELEAGVIEQISLKGTGRSSLADALKEPLQRFQRGSDDPAAGIPEHLARRLFAQTTLGTALGFYLLIGAVGFCLELASVNSSSGLGMEMFRRLRLEGFKRGLEVEPGILGSMPNAPGQLTAALHQGAVNAKETYEYLLEAAQESVSVITVIVLLATRSIWLSVGCVVLVGGQALISVLQARRLRNERNELDKRRNDLAARTDDILSKKEIVLAWEQQARYASKLDDYTARYADVDRKLNVSEAVFNNLSTLLTDYGRIAVLVMALVLALSFSGSAISNIGDAYFLTSLYVRLFVPVSNLLRRYDSIRRSEATSRTYLRLLAESEPALTVSGAQLITPNVAGPEIRLEGVHFLYGPGPDRRGLTDCSFAIPPGSVTLLLGPSGCGKTTVARLLLGFMRPQAGEISIGDRNAATMSGTELRLLMSYVSQDAYIVDDTVRENLSWSAGSGNGNEEYEGALVQLGIAEPSEALALLDKSAKDLSVGQQQRLSLCRILLDRSPILILDEPLTGVDVFTLQEIIPPLIRSVSDTRRTVLLISHRVAFVSHATHVVIMNSHGSVVEEGNPQGLLANPNSILSELYETAVTELGNAGPNPHFSPPS